MEMKLESDCLDFEEINALAGDLAPAYRRPRDPFGRPTAVIALDACGRVWARPTTDECGQTWDEADGRTQVVPIYGAASGNQIIEFLATYLDKLEAVHVGHKVVWDGDHHVGHLTEEAADALEQITFEAREYGFEWMAPPHVDIWDWLFESRNLTNVWSANRSLTEVIHEVEQEIQDLAEGVVDGDIRQCLIDAAYIQFIESEEPQIGASHVTALLEAGRITEDEARLCLKVQSDIARAGR